MTYADNRTLRQYRQVDVHSGLEGATPHRLIRMLMDGALSRIAAAAGNMDRGELAAKGENIGRAISIIEGLKGSLDLDAGGSVAGNLDSLYDYLTRRLLEANVRNDAKILDETRTLLAGIKEAWEAIVPPQGDGGDGDGERGEESRRPAALGVEV